MANAFGHVELNTGDLAAAKKFYKKLFDWKLTDTPMGPGVYTLVDTGDRPDGGMRIKPVPEVPTAWLPYVEVADVKKSLAKARKLGAQVVVDTTDIGDSGWIGVFVDPTGAALGLWASRPKVKRASKKKVGKAALKKK